MNDVAESMQREIERLRREWERECDDGDAVLQAVGLTPADYRTDGGSINVPKVRSKIMAQEVSRRAKINALRNALQAVLAYPTLREYIGPPLFDYAQRAHDDAFLAATAPKEHPL